MVKKMILKIHHYIFINKTFHFNFHKTPIISTLKPRSNSIVQLYSKVYTLQSQSTVHPAKITNYELEKKNNVSVFTRPLSLTSFICTQCTEKYWEKPSRHHVQNTVSSPSIRDSSCIPFL